MTAADQVNPKANIHDIIKRELTQRKASDERYSSKKLETDSNLTELQESHIDNINETARMKHYSLFGEPLLSGQVRGAHSPPSESIIGAYNNMTKDRKQGNRNLSQGERSLTNRTTLAEHEYLNSSLCDKCAKRQRVELQKEVLDEEEQHEIYYEKMRFLIVDCRLDSL